MKLSRLVDNVSTVDVEFNSMDELAQLITLTNWAPGVFRTNYRNLTNFVSTDIIALDIDEGCTIEEAKKLFASYEHVIATTRNHQKEKNGKTCDRFRVLLRLSEPISSARIYTSTYLSIGVHFPFIDLACGDAARQFYSSLCVVSIQSTGQTIQPVERGAIAKSTIEFMAKEVDKGKWNRELFKAAKDLQQQGYDKDETVELLKRPTGHLDNKDLSTIESAYNKEPRHPARIETSDGQPFVDQWVGEWVIQRKLDLKYNEQIHLNGETMNYSQIEDRLLIDTSKTGFKYSKDILFASLRVYYDEAIKTMRESYIAKLAYQPCETNLVGAFVKALEGTENPLSEAVIRHFIWSVKTKMNRRDVIYHLMPILVGKTEGGKSRALHNFLKPLDSLTIPKTLDIVNDERQNFNFSKYYVVLFDEMSHIGKADIDCLKNIITSPEVSYRMLGKNKNSIDKNVSTFIGASNTAIKHLINDPTSARRYYQLNCQNVLDWDVITNHDYLAMWRSVDENGPSPILPMLTELKAHQELSRAQSFIEEWLELACTTGVDDWTLHTDALREFTQWYKDLNQRVYLRPNRFYEDLAKLVLKRRKNGSYEYNLKVKASINLSF